MLEHPVKVAVARDRELKAYPESVKGRVPRAQQPHCCRYSADAGHLVLQRDRLEREVVPEPLRLLVRVGVTADSHQQRRVVDDRALLLIEPDPLGQAQRDQALPQHVLHRLAEAEIDPQRQRRHQLGQANVSAVDVGHSQSVTPHRTESSLAETSRRGPAAVRTRRLRGP